MERNDKERFNQLFEQIIEIAGGNFEYRHKISGRRDALDTLGELLNIMAEEVAYFNYENVSHLATNTRPILVVFDQKGEISNYSFAFLDILGHKKLRKNINTSINQLLTEYSIPLLHEELKSIRNEELNQDLFSLDFKTADNRILRANCTLGILFKKNKKKAYVLSIYEDFKNQSLKSNTHQGELNYKSLKSKSASNRILVKNVRLYVLRNLNKPLPALKQIGLLHQTNQTKLKSEFKNAYGLTIHQFHNKKRLERAALLLKTTELPISVISNQCGYKSLAHFSRKFKEFYSSSPRLFRSTNLK
ncbi:AraC family transcriptional regulator [Leeuwenhoekiella aequorea]|uniref:helix-turn-helix transcriptional regulator n=1 Tax=Leeuwenhoekiella aequorea TaxID=283736 RepID=UPI000856A6C6|nr:transcriptional regulator, AraC family [uncultured bacterium]|tara:strand:+ start:24065 stop:24976 length:912 start_codon:yes stop_codon:yes gene_type:complete